MSATKVIFTYKRKRLSSCSGVGHADVCPELSSDVKVDKQQDAPKRTSQSPEKDLKYTKCVTFERDSVVNSVNCTTCPEPYHYPCTESHFKHTGHREELPTAFSSPQVDKSNILKENNHVGECETTNNREMSHGSYDFSGDSTFKTSSENISVAMCLGQMQTRGSSVNDKGLVSHVDGYGLDASVSQSAEEHSDSLPKQNFLSKSEMGKANLTAPLRTFSRRLKRKADVGSAVMFSDLHITEGSGAIKDCESMCLSPGSCEATSDKTRPVEELVDLRVPINGSNVKNVLCQSRDEMINKEAGDSSCPCTESNAEAVIMDHNEGGTCPEKELILGTSPTTNHTPNKTLESIVSPFPDVVETKRMENVGCSSNDGTVVSFCGGTSETDDHHVSHQLRASSGDSQLTSSDGSDLKLDSQKTVEQKISSASLDLSCRTPGAFVIDCNVIPDSDISEQPSGIVHDSSLIADNHENTVQEGHGKSRGLELFGGTGVQAESSLLQSSKDFCTSVEDSKPPKKCLQLFSEDGKSDLFPSACTNSQIVSSEDEQNANFAFDCEKDLSEQSSSKISAFLGLALPTESLLDRTFEHGSTVHQFQDHYVRTREFQNPVAHSFSDHASLIFRHKILLESINTKATALRGNSNISLEKLEASPILWSEEELDSLWIGIRRHGRGNWHAMLLDPRLLFAPWRVARDLADQWEREHRKLLSGQHMPQGRYLKPPDPFNVDCSGSFVFPRTGAVRETISAETKLSLGDVYAQKDTNCFRSGSQSFRIKHPRKRVRVARSKAGNYSCGLIDNLQNNVMVRGEVSPDGLAMGLATNNHLPHWLREPIGASSRSMEPLIPQTSTLTHMGALQLVHQFQDLSGTSYGPRNLMNNRLSGLMATEVQPPNGVTYAGPLIRKEGTANNLIVIDSDASSEETISDDHNIRC